MADFVIEATERLEFDISDGCASVRVVQPDAFGEQQIIEIGASQLDHVIDILVALRDAIAAGPPVDRGQSDA